MRITITAKHVRVTQAMKDYAKEKLEKLDRYFDRIESIRVILDKDGMDNVCEIAIRTAMHNELVAMVHNQDDMHAAVDLCLDKCHRQLKKIKEKARGHKGADKRKKLGRDVKKVTMAIPREETYEDVINE